jgi:phosphoglycerate dehydrogenase-like enzyme
MSSVGIAVEPTMMRVAVLDDWQAVAHQCADWNLLDGKAEVTFLYDAFPDADALVAALSSYDIVLPMRERTFFPAAVIDALPRLKMFALTGNSMRHIDRDAVRRRGIVCAWSGEYRPAETAEFALGLILAADRDIARGDAIMRAGGFQRGTGLGFAMAGRTLGIVGLGNIGRLMARYGIALGMEVLAWSPTLTADKASEAGARAVSLDELLAQSDVVTVHVTLKPETLGLIGARQIALMKPGALLVNTSRGPLVDEGALVTALRERRIRAALDVFDAEPLPADHPLRNVPGTLLAPHLGFSTWSCYRMFYGECVENIAAFIEGRPLRLLEV